MRSPIRLLLLKVFGALCGLDHAIVSVLLSSVLPLELARDIKNNTSGMSTSHLYVSFLAQK